MPIIASADNGAHGAIWLHHNNRRLFCAVLAAELAQDVLDHAVRVFLQPVVQRSPYGQHAVGPQPAFAGQPLDLLEGEIEIPVGRKFARPLERCRRVLARRENLALRQEACIDHVLQHVVGAPARRRQIDMRRKARRRLEQAREHCRFRQRHIANGLAEIEFRCGLNAEGAAAHVGAVEIEFENVVLAQPRLEPHRQKSLAHLAVNRALVGQEQVLRQLLRDG